MNPPVVESRMKPVNVGWMRRFPDARWLSSRQLRIDDVGKDVRPNCGAAADRLHLQLRFRLEEIIGHLASLAKVSIVFEDEALASRRRTRRPTPRRQC